MAVIPFKFRLACVGLLAIVLSGCIRTSSAPPPNNDLPIGLQDPLAKFGSPAASAPVALREFGQLRGRWSCRISERGADGIWTERPTGARWTWYYALGGYAVQDLWEPQVSEGQPASVGTSLRTFDPQSGVWHSAWTSTAQAQFERWHSIERGARLVLENETSSARIQFHEIRSRSFDWRYQVFGDGVWQSVLRTQCTRLTAD